MSKCFLLLFLCLNALSRELISSTISYKIEDTLYIRVYICNGYTIIERVHDSYKWYYDTFNSTGSSVVATYYMQVNQPHIRLYVGKKGMIQEYQKDGLQNWQIGSLYTPGLSASAMTYMDNDNPRIRVYVTLKNNTIIEWGNDGGAWNQLGFYL